MNTELTKEETAGIFLGTLLGLALWCARLAAIVMIALWTVHFAVKLHLAPPIPCGVQTEVSR